jgi:hypothetical protein
MALQQELAIEFSGYSVVAALLGPSTPAVVAVLSAFFVRR